MKITFNGQFSFNISTKNGTVLINPKDESKAPKDLLFSIFSSENAPDIFGGKNAINWPGEFEIGGIFTKSIKTREDNLAQIFNAENINFGFLGDLKKIISQEKLEPMVNTDVLFLPKTADGMPNKDLKKLVEEIDPRIVILSGDESLFPELLKEFNAETAEKMKEFELSASKMPLDQTIFVQLSSN